MPDLSEWLDYAQKHRAPGERAWNAQVQHAKMAETVALRMEDLLQRDDWQTYALHLDGLIAMAETEVATFHVELLAPHTVGDALASLRVRVAEAKGRLDAFRLARGLPDQLRGASKIPLTVTAGTV